LGEQKRTSMNPKVFVPDVIEALEFATEETSSYIHRSTGRVVTISDEDMRYAEDRESDRSDLPDWRKNAVAEALEVLASEQQWLPLPSKFDLHEWKLMDDFVRTLEDHGGRDELAYAIRGKGAFRMFKGTIRRLGLEDAWYAYKAASLDHIAREWLTEHGFEPASQRQVAGKRAASDGMLGFGSGADAPPATDGASDDEDRGGERPATSQCGGDERGP